MPILTRTPACPWCGLTLTAVTHLGDHRAVERPTPGMVSLCNRCAKPLVWHGQKLVRPLTGPEIAGMDPKSRRALLLAITAARQELFEARQPGNA